VADDIEKLKKELEAAKKALADTKASYTKGQQALAATKAELKVLEEAGVKIPSDITKLKSEDPEKYASELEKYNSKLTKMRQEQAEQAKEKLVEQTLTDLAKQANMTAQEVQENVPPAIYTAYKNGDLSADHVVKLAIQYKTGKPVIKSPTTQKEFDFSSVAGGLLDEHTTEQDDTLNPKDYII